MKYLLHKILQEHCSEHDLDKWFTPLNIEYDDVNAKLTVFFPHAFFEPWFVKQGKEIFENAVEKFNLQNFKYIANIEYRNLNQDFQIKTNTFNTFFEKNKQNELNKTFDNFFYNSKNELTISTIKELAHTFPNASYNPFIIYGDSSTGKTHLLNAIVHEITLNKNSLNVFFGTAGDLNQSLSSANIKNFINKYSLFIVDNFHNINIYSDFQQSFIRFIDLCIAKNKQLIFATNSIPTAQKNFIEGLRSRLALGLAVHLEKPDIDIRMRFALDCAQEHGFKLSKNHLLVISQQCSNISFLRGVITKIHALHSFSQKDLDDNDIENILLSFGDDKSPISAQDIISVISKHFNIDRKKLLDNSRQPHIVQARQIAMHLCRDLFGLSYPSIGKIFGGKDHSTVMYSIKKINLLIDTHKETQILVTNIKQKCLDL